MYQSGGNYVVGDRSRKCGRSQLGGCQEHDLGDISLASQRSRCSKRPLQLHRPPCGRRRNLLTSARPLLRASTGPAVVVIVKTVGSRCRGVNRKYPSRESEVVSHPENARGQPITCRLAVVLFRCYERPGATIKPSSISYTYTSIFHLLSQPPAPDRQHKLTTGAGLLNKRCLTS